MDDKIFPFLLHFSMFYLRKDEFIGLTSMQACVLLNMRELFESPVTIGAFIGFFARVDPYVLRKLVVRGERLETLLALVGFHFSSMDFPCMVLHSRLVQEDLKIHHICVIRKYGQKYLNMQTGIIQQELLSYLLGNQH